MLTVLQRYLPGHSYLMARLAPRVFAAGLLMQRPPTSASATCVGDTYLIASFLGQNVDQVHRDVLSLIADYLQDLLILVVTNKSMCCNTILPMSKNIPLRPEKYSRKQMVGYTKHAVGQQDCPTPTVTGWLLSLGEACPSDQYENVSMNCPMQIDFLHLPGPNIPAPVPADTHRKNRIYDGTERLSR
jgi:hypothetical protein